ncbi:hypothetical protein JKP88DRAFT_335083 [Tribonema minus]|uniref:DUF4954 domain-containing protein n=1 Tax=Tribonema minus TaxID=303371 RepID=A0A835YSQ7_9STRA|nr:hypothetical protein JKP88DRAFT_335083 [Tribonema minus]
MLQQGRALSDSEIQQLERQGNWSTAWHLVRYAGSSNADGPIDFCSRIRNCSFVGPVLLHDFHSTVVLAETSELPSGVYNSSLSMVLVGPGALIKDCSLVSNAVLREGSALVRCSNVSCVSGTSYGNGISIPVGPETGGREVPCCATTCLPQAAYMAAGSGTAVLRAAYISHVSQQQTALSAAPDFTVLEAGAQAIGCNIVSAYLGPCARVESSQLDTVTVLSQAGRPVHIQGASVRQALLQPGAHVGGGATVACALIMEHARVDLHAKLTSTILAPHSHIGAGECHHSLVGAFVRLRRQSLLIAALWPLGRGHVCYGANVGSNHTARIPDQEMWAGEGVFIGLAVSIKYPFNTTEAPYSIIGAGTTCLPQRIALPFSLIAPPDTAAPPGAPLGFNHLHPAWVLTESLYSVARSAAQCRSSEALCQTPVGWDVFRRSTVQLMVHARHGGSAVPLDHVYVGEAQVAGLGKNVMTEAARRQGEAAYTLHIRCYALAALLRWLERNGRRSAPPPLPPPPTVLLHVARELAQPPPTGEAQLRAAFESAAGDEDAEWSFQRALLGYEFGAALESVQGVRGLLRELKAVAAAAAAAVAASKGRDDTEGEAVIPGYASAHISAQDDPIVVAAQRESEMIASRVDAMLVRLL